MSELFSHIGTNTDVPAGDIGVGGRENGFLFGMYKKLQNEFTGVLTGKGMTWGGSLIRPEATGYGTVYFAEKMLQTKGDSIKGKTVCISGSGNVAQYAAEKIIQLGGKVITLSDSSGYILDTDGINKEKLAFVMDLKNNKRGRISAYVDTYTNAQFFANKPPWEQACDVAMPCATQNELSGSASNPSKNITTCCSIILEKSKERPCAVFFMPKIYCPISIKKNSTVCHKNLH